MNDRKHNEHLLDDILAEEAPVGFREALLRDTLHLARRRRRFRQVRRATSALAVAAGLFFVVWHSVAPRRGPPEPPAPYVLVRTHPLSPGVLLESQPLSPGSLVTSAATADVVTTAAAGYRPREIDDEELLALAAPNPVVLVRHGPHQAELVFADLPEGEASP
jgi:hypothetical protein